MIKRVHCWLCKLICPSTKEPVELSFEIREASHKMANTVAEIQASASRYQNEARVFQSLASAMRGKGSNR